MKECIMLPMKRSSTRLNAKQRKILLQNSMKLGKRDIPEYRLAMNSINNYLR
nr:MAG TPA: hypothetical protein [Caudoviricetes sp.]